MSHREASIGEVLAQLAAMGSGRPSSDLVLRWVLTMLEDDDVVDSKETAHAFRCEEAYVCWCCEIGVRRGDLQRQAPRWRLVGVAPPVEAWSRSRLDPLARLTLEAVFDAARDRFRAERP